MPDHAHHRDLGRPRTFTETDVFRVVTRMMQTHSGSHMTLTAIAREVGCTGQALNARFGSRLELLAAYADWTAARDIDRFKQIDVEYPPGPEAIKARFLLPLDERAEELSESGNQRRMLWLYAELGEDPDISSRLVERGAAFERELARMIEKAQAAGTLAVVSPSILAHIITAVTIGIAILGTKTRQSILEEMEQALDCVLAPYLPTPSSCNGEQHGL